jgi:hypothetical protein
MRVIFAAAALLLAACSTSVGSVTVGAYDVGPPRCTDPGSVGTSDREECRRLTTYAQHLLDQASHAPVDSVAIYAEPPNALVETFSGFHDFAIVAFKLADGAVQAFYIRCGVGTDETLCMDLRPLKPGFGLDEHASNPNPVSVP